MNNKEQIYYPVIKQKFFELFQSKRSEVYLEITANKRFSNRIKSKIPESRQIIFSFLGNVRPDITGYIEEDKLTDFVIIEIKKEELKLGHIYQARKYAELFYAKFAFLVSTKEIPEEIKRLSKAIYSLLSLPAYRSLILVYFEEGTKSFKVWYPENPFEKDDYWR
jgi:hypothetical protein